MGYSLEKHLKNLCEENSKYSALFATWELDKRIYENALMAIVYNFPHYSLHNHSHSETIINKIEMVLGEKSIKKLQPTETWLLLQVAYLHDFGMILYDELIEKEWQSKEFQKYLENQRNSGNKDIREAAVYIMDMQNNISEKIEKEKQWPIKIRNYVVQLIAEYFRKKHASLSQNWVEDIRGWNLHNGLIPERLFRLAGKISQLHGEKFEEVLKLNYVTNGVSNDLVHPRFIACMLRLGDLLDLDNGRFNMFVTNVFGKVPKLSKVHEKKHASIDHILITPEIIEVMADCPDEIVYRETRTWLKWLKEELTNISINWSRIVHKDFEQVPPRIGKIDLLLKSRKDVSEEVDLKFEISQKDAFELLEGAGIYDDKLVCMREFIQNALDASKVQLWKDLKDGQYSAWINDEKINENMLPYEIPEEIYKNYEINISVDEIKGDNGKLKSIKFEIQDRGTGISNNELKSIAKVGTSWNEKEHMANLLESMPDWMKPSGGFGIGMQSAFRVTDEIKIITKAEENSTKEIHFISGREDGYISIVDAEKKMNRGTKVIIEICKSKCNELNNNEVRSLDYFDMKDGSKEVQGIIRYCRGLNLKSTFSISLRYKEKIIGICDYEKIIRKMNEIKEMKKCAHNEKEYMYKNFTNKDDEIGWLIYELSTCSVIKIKMPRGKGYERYEKYFTKMYFKGIEINKNNYQSMIFRRTFFNIEWDILGMDVKKILTLNRKKIRTESISKLKDILDTAIAIGLEELKEKIDCISNKNVNCFNLAMIYKKYKNKDGSEWEKKFINKLIAKCNKIEIDIWSMKNETNEVESKKITAEDLLMNISDYGILANRWDEFVFEDIKEILRNSKMKFKAILKNNIDIVEKLKGVCFVNKSEYMEIRKRPYYIVGLKDLFDQSGTIEVSKEIKKMIFLKTEVGLKRSCIPPIKGYESLLVSNKNISNIGSMMSTNNIKLDIITNSKCKIILPIIREDYMEIMKNTENKEIFIEKIKSRNDFINLVEYVYQYSVIPEKNKDEKFKEKIIQEYEQLVGEIYDITIENHQEDKEKSDEV
ncbi:MAG: ATP-binding protein [Marinisporobacter sp.]|jgi:hypothetical protein|nr:ATP-binding protein [Marinisporobacter sp.]